MSDLVPPLLTWRGVREIYGHAADGRRRLQGNKPIHRARFPRRRVLLLLLLLGLVLRRHRVSNSKALLVGRREQGKCASLGWPFSVVPALQNIRISLHTKTQEVEASL